MKKTKAQQQFENGYEQGKLSVVIKIYNQLYYEMKDSQAKKQMLDFLWENFEEYIPNYGTDEPSAFEKKFCYMTTVTYRGKDVDVFVDDCGQQYYFYYKNKSYSCGAYNFNYEADIKYVIDKDLDRIVSFKDLDARFFGAYCEYANHEHTQVELTFRGEHLKTFDVDLKNVDDSIKDIKDKCFKILQDLFNDPEFIKSEEERKASGKLYFNEIVDK